MEQGEQEPAIYIEPLEVPGVKSEPAPEEPVYVPNEVEEEELVPA
jgi:hypothetical protein